MSLDIAAWHYSSYDWLYFQCNCHYPIHVMHVKCEVQAGRGDVLVVYECYLIDWLVILKQVVSTTQQ